MYGYWAAGGIDSHDEGATDHPETETPAVPALLHLLLRLPSPPFVRTSIPVALPFGSSLSLSLSLNTLLASYTILSRRASLVIRKMPADP